MYKRPLSRMILSRRFPALPPGPLRSFCPGFFADDPDGSLAREHVRDKYFNKSWDEFNSAVEALRPKSGSDLPNKAAFWWLLPDIIVSSSLCTLSFQFRLAHRIQLARPI